MDSICDTQFHRLVQIFLEGGILAVEQVGDGGADRTLAIQRWAISFQVPMLIRNRAECIVGPYQPLLSRTQREPSWGRFVAQIPWSFTLEAASQIVCSDLSHIWQSLGGVSPQPEVGILEYRGLTCETRVESLF